MKEKKGGKKEEKSREKKLDKKMVTWYNIKVASRESKENVNWAVKKELEKSRKNF